VKKTFAGTKKQKNWKTKVSQNYHRFFERNDLETIEVNGFTVVKPDVLLSFTEIFIPVTNAGQ
jgi:hypothetical protein